MPRSNVHFRRRVRKICHPANLIELTTQTLLLERGIDGPKSVEARFHGTRIPVGYGYVSRKNTPPLVVATGSDI